MDVKVKFSYNFLTKES